MLRIKYRSLNGRFPPEVSQRYWFPVICASASSNPDIHRSHVNFHLGFVESSSDLIYLTMAMLTKGIFQRDSNHKIYIYIYLTNFTDSFSMAGQSAICREFLWRYSLQKLCEIAGRPNNWGRTLSIWAKIALTCRTLVAHNRRRIRKARSRRKWTAGHRSGCSRRWGTRIWAKFCISPGCQAAVGS